MLIGVVTPTLTAMQHLGDCIESICIQQRPDVEVEHIVVDGGSSDGTVELTPVTGLRRDDRQGRGELRRHQQRLGRLLEYGTAQPEPPVLFCHTMPSTCGPGGGRAPGDERAAS